MLIPAAGELTKNRRIRRQPTTSLLPEVVVNPLVVDDDAVEPTPTSLPMPALLGAGSIALDVGGRRFRRQRLAAVRTTGRCSSLETATTLARLDVGFQCRAHFLLPRAIGQFRHSLIPHRSEEHTSELQSRPHLVC